MPDLTRRELVAAAALMLAVRPAQAGEPLVLRAAAAEMALGDMTIASPAFNELASGPLLEARRGEPLSLAVENTLDFPLRVQLQGLRGQSVRGHDEAIAAGETRQIILTPPDAGTFVYCAVADDAHRATLLSGPLVVSVEEPPVADREVLLAVNTIVVPDTDPAKPAHRIVTVNGGTGLDIVARPGERLRVRLINLAQESVAGARLPKGATVIAIDGQPCEPFPPFDDAMFLPPLGRADIVVDMPPDASDPLLIRDAFDPSVAFAAVTPQGALREGRYLAERLPVNTRLPKEIPFRSAVRATWMNEPSGPLARLETGASMILTFDAIAEPRAVRLEGHVARVLDQMDDGWKGWWVDTLVLQPDEPARLAFVAEQKGRYAVEVVPLAGTRPLTRAFIDVT